MYKKWKQTEIKSLPPRLSLNHCVRYIVRFRSQLPLINQYFVNYHLISGTRHACRLWIQTQPSTFRVKGRIKFEGQMKTPLDKWFTACVFINIITCAWVEPTFTRMRVPQKWYANDVIDGVLLQIPAYVWVTTSSNKGRKAWKLVVTGGS